MRFVDTNVFLRYLTRDDPQKSQACYELFKRCERNEEALLTSEAVVAEIVYVLSSKQLYDLSPEEVRVRLMPLLSLTGMRLPNRNVCLRALELYAAYAIDFEDALAVSHMEQQGLTEIYSYDRDFGRLAHIVRIEP
jgi:predicted nucleic acid-binding protein